MGELKKQGICKEDMQHENKEKKYGYLTEYPSLALNLTKCPPEKKFDRIPPGEYIMFIRLQALIIS